MASRNRQAGHNFERHIVNLLKEMGYEAVSSRYESRSLDDAGVDIVTNFPLKIQCKSSVNTPNIHKLLTETEANTIVWRKQKKKGKRFYAQGDYVILKLDTLFNLIKQTADGNTKTLQGGKP